MQTIEFYYDLRSPYSYFASQRMSLLIATGATIIWRPVFVDVLLNLQQDKDPWDEPVDPFCPPKRAHFMADIFRMIEYWNIPFNMPSPPKPNCNVAMGIAAILERDGIEHEAFLQAVFKAAWQDQKDTQSEEVLQKCLADNNLENSLIERSLTEGKELLTETTRLAYERGVFGVPSFVFDDQVYFGADRMELLAAKIP